jgi:hypothetical protein
MVTAVFERIIGFSFREIRIHARRAHEREPRLRDLIDGLRFEKPDQWRLRLDDDVEKFTRSL